MKPLVFCSGKPSHCNSVLHILLGIRALATHSRGRRFCASCRRYGDRGTALDPPGVALEAARESVRVEAATPAVWGEPSAMATTDAAPAPAPPMPAAGAKLDVRQFRHSRTIPAGPAGLVALPLDAAVLAHSAGPDRGFADVRVLDSTGRQVPYLVERRDEPLTSPPGRSRRQVSRPRQGSRGAHCSCPTSICQWGG